VQFCVCFQDIFIFFGEGLLRKFGSNASIIEVKVNSQHQIPILEINSICKKTWPKGFC
jgi:hypothetical protein